MRQSIWAVIEIKRTLRVVIFPFLLILILISTSCKQQNETQTFDKERAFKDIEYQISLGPRVPDSNAHKTAVNWILSELEKSNWESEVSVSEIKGVEVKNIIGKRGVGRPWIIIGAHYDSRIYADRDPIQENKKLAVPGANDGASGVAVLLELGRILPIDVETTRFNQIWLVFFDAEDNGGIGNWDWIMGSTAFAQDLESLPDAVVIVDMIGDENLNIFMEKNSDKSLTKEIWSTADSLGYSNYFIPHEKYTIIDDHIPFKELGIPVVDIIDFDYVHWHTTNDLPENVSAKSLEIVGNTLLSWLINKP
jgi:Zn-dependent M28 family amino/carboxypeptidase